jgi:catechol 2,3-dioxygenase-like lactoylglutathione lyase family enzyme
MIAMAITLIMNVSNMEQSFEWFAKLGWKKRWDWGDPPGFGCVCSGECEIFLCLDGQGVRGRSDQAATFGENGSDTADRGIWMSVWVDDVDEIYRNCLDQGIEIAFGPSDMPWNAREMHIRHPDGHIFRISRGVE